MPDTPRAGLRRPEGADAFTISADQRHNVDILDKVAFDDQGTFALRPLATAVKSGTYYFATDLGVTFRSDGVAWFEAGRRTPLGIAITELENNALGWGKIAKDGAGFKAEGFSAFATSAQGVATTSPTKVQLDGEEYDSSSRFDLSNDRFTPQLKGAYEVTGCVGFFTSASAAQGADLRLYKNGVLHSVLAKYGKLDAGCGYGLSGVAQVEMNGSSDYLELFVVPTTASLMNLGQLFSSDDNASIATYKATRFAAKLLGRTT